MGPEGGALPDLRPRKARAFQPGTHMTTRRWDPEGLRFKRYLGPVLDALRALGGSGTPREVFDQVARDLKLPTEALTEVRKSGSPRLANQLSWARLYLKFEGLVGTSKRGIWSLTDKGRMTHLTVSDALATVARWDKVFAGNEHSRQAPAASPRRTVVIRRKGAEPSSGANPPTAIPENGVPVDQRGGDAAWLIANGFIPIGTWSTAAPKLQRTVTPPRVRAVYAFVVNDRILYIGKATNVRGRLRIYNKSLLPKDSRPLNQPFRLVHDMIGETVSAGGTVDVWIREYGSTSPGTIEALETRWIREKQPKWNVVGVEGRPSRWSRPPVNRHSSGGGLTAGR